jgi:hypothetical protein
MGPLYANAGSARGALRYGEVPAAIGILEALDDPMLVGRARGVGWDPDGLGRIEALGEALAQVR